MTSLCKYTGTLAVEDINIREGGFSKIWFQKARKMFYIEFDHVTLHLKEINFIF